MSDVKPASLRDDYRRLALAALLALGGHAALLFGVSANWRLSFPPPPPSFEMRLAQQNPLRLPPEPALPEWLPPAPPASPATPVLASPPVAASTPKPPSATVPKPPPKPIIAPTPKPPPKPVIAPAPKPPPKPVARLAPKAPPAAKPLPKPARPPQSALASRPQPRMDDPPLSKPAMTVKPATTVKPAASHAQPAERRRSSAAVAPALGSLDSAALLGQIASLETAQQRKASAGGRVQRVSPTDSRSAAGFYAADWARKVTRVGEMNFPDAARRLNSSAGPSLEVAIRADGSLQEARIVRSSGHAELDAAARRIVNMAAPYPPFPPELRRDIDLLRIEAPWRFDPGGRVRAR